MKTNHIEDAKGETHSHLNYSATKRKSIQDLYDNIDPLMEFKPPFIDVTIEEFIYVDKEMVY
jgi:methylenetetrahydrofolate reductase (NADPH)